MPYSDVNASHALLAAHLKSGRIAHTYLFSGPAGEAKSRLILEFARALNCERNRFFETCDCPSCRKIENRAHPDVQWFEADAKTGALKIEEVRERLHQASLKPYEGKWKVFILENAENLTPDASNALLKTLEEPPEHTVFLLLVENKAHLLETVQSRAFHVRTSPMGEKDPGEDAVIQLLESKGWEAYFEELRGFSRAELGEGLETLLHYLLDRSVSEWDNSRENSRAYLKALEVAYEAREALDANANQKLTLTYLEVMIRKAFNECSKKEQGQRHPEARRAEGSHSGILRSAQDDGNS